MNYSRKKNNTLNTVLAVLLSTIVLGGVVGVTATLAGDSGSGLGGGGGTSVTNPVDPVKPDPYRDSIKILSIGNSFSDDAHTYLYTIFKAFGVKDVTIANMYIGGCSLETHYNNAVGDTAAYTYQLYDNKETRVDTGSQKISEALTAEKWDVVTFQQVSGNSGLANTYNTDYINYLTNLAETTVDNADLEIGWHMTWAYQADSSHSSFTSYGNNQMTMYNGIVGAVKEKIVTNNNIDFVIPAGTAIQNARTSYLGDTLTRDGYHLNNQGKFIAGLTWALQITGWNVSELDTSEIPSEFETAVNVVKESAKNAVKTPYSITVSAYPETPETTYTLLDWQPAVGYWNSNEGSGLYWQDYSNSTATNLPYFVSSKVKFSREDLPNGTIIRIADGWHYRPEGFDSLEGGSTITRPANVTTAEVIVDDAWWGDYQYRAFNVSLIGNSTDLRDRVDEARAALTILVPNK